MTNKTFHICILVSGQVFEVPYGEEKYTNSLAQWLTNHEFKVTVVGRGGLLSTKYKHFFTDESNIHKTNKTRQEKSRKFFGLRYLTYATRPLISILFIIKGLSIHKKYPIDLIHAQDTGYAGLAAIILSKILRKSNVISSHGIRHKILESNTPLILKQIGFVRYERNLDIFNVKNADNIIAANPHIKLYYESISHRRIDFFPTPISINDFCYSEKNRDTIRTELKIGEKVITIGYIGRLTEEKNLSMLILSFKKVVEKIQSIKLILVGDGPIRDQLAREVYAHDIQNHVIFTGLRNDIARILSAIDIFVLPSFTEGWSTALLEAMACGRAIICSEIEANREMVTNGKEALCIDPYKPSELSESILLLHDNHELRQKLGHNAQIRSKLYDKDNIFPNVAKYYQRYSNK